MDETQAHIEAIGDQLRAKISSKFQVSTFLAGFGLAVLTVQISTFWQSAYFPHFLPVSISITLASIIIYIAAILALDTLTWPKRFWKQIPGIVRVPPKLAYLEDDDLWKLKNRMMFYWFSLTIVATGLTVISLILMLWQCSARQRSDETIRETFVYVVDGVIAALIYLAIINAILWCLGRRRQNWKPLGQPPD
jgi:hypothetical protein